MWFCMFVILEYYSLSIWQQITEVVVIKLKNELASSQPQNLLQLEILCRNKSVMLIDLTITFAPSSLTECLCDL